MLLRSEIQLGGVRDNDASLSTQDKFAFLEEFSMSYVEMKDSQFLLMLIQIPNTSLGPRYQDVGSGKINLEAANLEPRLFFFFFN